jgi:hypothetical protein
VKGTFISEINQWAPADFPAVKNDTYMGWDGGKRLWKDVVYNWTTSPSMAQRLAKIDLEAGRQQIVISGDFMLKAMQCQPGDVIQFNRSRLGWTNKHFEVERWDFKFMEGADGPTLAIALIGRETAEGVYDWADGEETTVDLALNTTLINPRSVPNVTGFAAAVATLAERTALPRMKLTWTSPANAAVTGGGHTELEYKKAADSVWIPWNTVRGDITTEYVTDLQVGTSFNFRARHVNIHGARSPSWVTATATASAGEGIYTALLTNEAHSVSCDSGGTPIAGELGSGGRAFSDILAYAGAGALSPVSSSPGLGQFSFTIATHSGTATWTKVDNDTFRCDSLSTDSAIGRATINLEGLLTVYKDFTITKVNSGNDGDPGTNGNDATVYWLVPDAGAINKSIAGAYTPSTLNLAAFSKTGTGAPAAYAGRFTIETFNGTSWSTSYTSGSNESTKAYTVPSSILAIRCRLYLAGGTSTLLDEQIVPIVFDGQTGATGATGGTGPTGPTGPAGATILGVVGGASTVNGTSPQAVGALVLNISVPAGARFVTFSGNLANASGSTNTGFCRIYCDGVAFGETFDTWPLGSGESEYSTITASTGSLSAGSHTFQMYAWGSAAHDIVCSGELTVL